MSGPLTSLSDRLSNLRSPEKCPEIAIFTGDGINDEHTNAIAEVLKISKSIIKLWLDRNAITNKGANDIGDALKSNTSIQYLNMSANQMTFEGAMAIFRGLKVNRSLVTLLLNKNSLVSNAAVAEQRHLWIGLQFNKSLQTLSLADNRMTDQTLTALCKGLSSNRTLTSINLAGNAFTGRDLAPTMLQGTLTIFLFSLLFTRLRKSALVRHKYGTKQSRHPPRPVPGFGRSKLDLAQPHIQIPSLLAPTLWFSTMELLRPEPVVHAETVFSLPRTFWPSSAHSVLANPSSSHSSRTHGAPAHSLPEKLPPSAPPRDYFFSHGSIRSLLPFCALR